MTINSQIQQTPAKLGVRARERNALERISELEQNLSAFFEATRVSFENNDKNVGELVEVMSAVVRILGAEAVANSLKEIQAERAEAEVAAAKAALQAKVDAGEFISDVVVTADSVIVGKEINEDGTEVFPGYTQLEFAKIKPEYQTKLLALSVGDVIDTENGRKFEITAVYTPVPKVEGAENVATKE